MTTPMDEDAPRPLWPSLVIAAGIGALGIVIVAFVVLSVKFGDDDKWEDVSCDELATVDAKDWRDTDTGGRHDLGRAFVRCETLIGASSGEVQKLFGIDPGATFVYIGQVNDLLGPGDTASLKVRYDRDGDTVESVRLYD